MGITKGRVSQIERGRSPARTPRPLRHRARPSPAHGHIFRNSDPKWDAAVGSGLAIPTYQAVDQRFGVRGADLVGGHA